MRFDQHYRADGNQSPSQDVTQVIHLESKAVGLTSFLSTHAGDSFEGGLYRIHPVCDMTRWTSIVGEAFPDFRERAYCFSYDWLGRHFALDLRREQENQYLVLMLEPGTGQALEIPCTFAQFHNEELVDFRNEALASDFYDTWLSLGGTAPMLCECVGYKKPLFLGGRDDVANLEITDMEVYWSIAGQLLPQIRNLPEGTRVRDIQIKD